MTYLVAGLDHAARRLTAACGRALAEKWSAFTNYEAGDYFTIESPAVSAGGAESSSPEVSAHLTAPSGERADRTPGEFAAVAVCEVLAEHHFWFANHSAATAGRCGCGARPHDQFDWREHVAAEVRRRIDAALTSQARQPIETGLEMGVSAASEFFPQHRRPQK